MNTKKLAYNFTADDIVLKEVLAKKYIRVINIKQSNDLRLEIILIYNRVR